MRLNVGAVAVVNKRPVSMGYNGTPPGEPHCRGNDCPGRFACRETVHAELNALEYIPDEHLYSDYGVDLYVTHSPCPDCTAHILRNNISRVFYGIPYRIVDHLLTIPRLFQVMPSGFVIDVHTGDVVDS